MYHGLGKNLSGPISKTTVDLDKISLGAIAPVMTNCPKDEAMIKCQLTTNAIVGLQLYPFLYSDWLLSTQIIFHNLIICFFLNFQVISELRNFNGNKTQATAALFAKSLKF